MWMGRAVGDQRDVGHALETGPDLRWNDHQRVVVGTEKALHELTVGRRAGALVVQHKLDPPPRASVIERHQPVAVPAFDHISVDRAEIDLSKFPEMRIGPPEHMVNSPALVGNSTQSDDL